MAGSESVEQNKQEGTKDDGKKPVEVKDEDLVCQNKLFQLIYFIFIFSRKKINN
jgi:hypothetical protein